MVKNPACQCKRLKRCGFDSWIKKVRWRKKWQPAPFCLGNPMDREAWWATFYGAANESDKTEHTHIHMQYFCMYKVKPLSRVWLFATPWTVTYQAPLSIRFPKQEYWSGLPFPSPRDLPDSGIEPRSPALQADALPTEPPGKALLYVYMYIDIYTFQSLWTEA